ncbi:Grainyhead-like protein 2 [Neolecta irregularis DAH-3]|uniref:Grainyhead-like protein 2 n=1 Tax=Neolecta irregularis (strain DAH-3) TaxID=1198029 RepID=A0A1U7LH36_NEOID|nr:Grainyhead-like protein 2 [Neolecta irregularis DAH-3]|eukprot:OLL21862.1 Grainyhead-like protein 2 [Neolecta irregularis DAH-3]
MYHSRQNNNHRPSDDMVSKFKESFPNLSYPNTHDFPQSIQARYEDVDATPQAAPSATFQFSPSMLDPTSNAFADFAAETPEFHHRVMNDFTTVNMGPHYDRPDLQMYSSYSILPLAPRYQHIHPPLLPLDYSSAKLHETLSNTHLKDKPDSEMHDGDSPDAKSDRDQKSRVSPTADTQHFRFLTTLHAQTAMTKYADEAPVTYLNKGQSYTVSVLDTTAPDLDDPPGRYRSCVRITFNDPEQRQHASKCWEYWKENRLQHHDSKDDNRRAISIDMAETRKVLINSKSASDPEISMPELIDRLSSFDTFAFLWSPPPSVAEYKFCMRFNFLSTDFSRNKGVKGCALRLNVRTDPTNASHQGEMSYCKIQLFRDKGAERKITNDSEHLRRTIDKLRQQAQQARQQQNDDLNLSGGDSGKKKKHTSSTPKSPTIKPTKRERALSSASQTARPSDDDINRKLDKAMAMEVMFASSRRTSVLDLWSAKEDDPYLHPMTVQQPPTSCDPFDLRIVTNINRRVSDGNQSMGDFAFSSPSDSVTSYSDHLGFDAASNWDDPVNRPRSAAGDIYRRASINMVLPKRLESTDRSGNKKWLEVLGSDPNYISIARSIKPALCVFILPQQSLLQAMYHDAELWDMISQFTTGYHHAVYIPARNQLSFKSAISRKFGLKLESIARVTRFTERGLRITVDDDVIADLNDGQDMELQVERFLDDDAVHVKMEGDDLQRWELIVKF